MKTLVLTVLGFAAISLLTVWSPHGAAPAAQGSTQPPASSPVPPPSPDDPALLRQRLLERLDARIDEFATKSKLELRIALDEVYPLPYLGVDSAPAAKGLALTAIYPDTGAEDAGLLKGDVLLSFGGVAVDSKASLARAVRSHRVGDSIELALERAGKPLTLRATLKPRPEEDEDWSEQFADLFGAPPPVAAPRSFDFEKAELGALPVDFESLLGGHGRLGRWLVVQTPGTKALRQDDDDRTGIRFPMAIVRDLEASDVVARVRFRLAGGRADRAAGIVLRYRDPGNYLVARANAGEADLRIFRVANGDRRTLPGGIAAGSTDDDRWHTLEFRAEGSKLTAVLDGQAQATAYDSFFLRGRVGLWTKADSQTEFDDLQIEPSK
jgi:hypothetical protein